MRVIGIQQHLLLPAEALSGLINLFGRRRGVQTEQRSAKIVLISKLVIGGVKKVRPARWLAIAATEGEKCSFMN